MDIETASKKQFAITRVASSKSGPFGEEGRLFHVNTYLFLNVSQVQTPSSLHRLARYREMEPTCPATAQGAADINGDQQDKVYPVFHDSIGRAHGDTSGDETLTTTLFDMHTCKATLFSGNPKLNNIQATFVLPAAFVAFR